ncbi:hypothetical protein SEVIR_3G254250v4 [Setaria viridis]
MYACGFVYGVGRVLFLLRRQSNGAAAGVVVAMERSGRHEDNGGQRNYAFMYGKLPKAHRSDKLARHNDPAPQVRRSDEPESQDSNNATAAGSAPTPALPPVFFIYF